MKIAVLGCTGQIGRCLVRAFTSQHELLLHARRPQAMQNWLDANGLSARVRDLSDFPSGDVDLIINAIGDGAPGKIRAAGSSIVETTERFDHQCLNYLKRNPGCGYIFMSTGRIYGEAYEAAQSPDPQPLPMHLLSEQPYPLAKLQAEHRHRQLPSHRIADIRIFGYVSDEISLDDDFLVAQILQALVNNLEFATTPRNFVRDYVGPEDLLALIGNLVDANIPNGAYDICSAGPVTKFELLQALARNFNFRYDIEGVPEMCGMVPELITRHCGSHGIGYLPGRTSLENVLGTTEAILRRTKAPDRCDVL